MEEFLANYAEAITVVVVGVLYEVIANSKLQSNSVFQLVRNILKGLLHRTANKK